MMVTANSTFFIGRSASLLLQQANSLFRELEERNKEPIINMGFREDEKGGSGGVFVK